MHIRKSKLFFFIILFLLVFFGILVVFVYNNYLSDNIRGVKYMINKINPPDGFYDPIVKEKLNFLEKGFSKTLNLNAKYKGLYDFGLEFEKKVLSTKHKFNGKFKLEFLVDAQILSEKTISAFKAWGSYFEDGYDTDYYKWIVLDTFEIPYQGKYLDNIKLRITVLEPDMELGKNQDFINIYIAASSIP